MKEQNQIKRIVVVGTQRSGTTWLMQVLSQIPQFNVYGEVFREIYMADFKGDPSLKPPMFFLDYLQNEQANASALDYVDNVLVQENKIVVFKIMYDQIRRNRDLLNLIADKHTLTINVQRLDIFEVALSKCIATKTGIFHTSGSLELTEFKVKYQTIYNLLMKEKIKEFIFPNLIKWFSKNYFHFTYEGLLENFDALSSTVEKLTHVDVSGVNPKKTKWKKTSKTSKHKAISNFDEINGKLKKSIFRAYAK